MNNQDRKFKLIAEMYDEILEIGERFAYESGIYANRRTAYICMQLAKQLFNQLPI